MDPSIFEGLAPTLSPRAADCTVSLGGCSNPKRPINASEATISAQNHDPKGLGGRVAWNHHQGSDSAPANCKRSVPLPSASATLQNERLRIITSVTLPKNWRSKNSATRRRSDSAIGCNTSQWLYRCVYYMAAWIWRQAYVLVALQFVLEAAWWGRGLQKCILCVERGMTVQVAHLNSSCIVCLFFDIRWSCWDTTASSDMSQQSWHLKQAQNMRQGDPRPEPCQCNTHTDHRFTGSNTQEYIPAEDQQPQITDSRLHNCRSNRTVRSQNKQTKCKRDTWKSI